MRKGIGSITLHVRNFGPIENASIELADYNILVGRNNLGKSTFCQVLYALQTLHRNTARVSLRPPAKLRRSDELLRMLHRQRSKSVNDALTRLATDFVLRWAGEYAHNYRRYFRRGVEGYLESVFAASPYSLVGVQAAEARLHIILDDPWFRHDVDVRIARNRKTGVHINIKPHTETLSAPFVERLKQSLPGFLRQVPSVDMLPERDVDIVYQQLAFRFFDLSLRFWEQLPAGPHAYYVPAGRAGLLESWNTVAQTLVSMSTEAPLRRIDISPIPGTAAQFYQVLLGLRGEQGPFGKLVGSKMSRLTGGKLILERQQTPYSKIFYRFAPSSEREMQINIVNASSMVKELAPILLIISEKLVPGDLLVIEEPESHLHPGLQLEIVQLLQELARRHVRVVVTTHSDLLVRRATQLLAQAKADEKPASVLALFRGRPGYTTVRALPTEPPVEIETFDEVVKDLYEEELKIEYGSTPKSEAN